MDTPKLAAAVAAVALLAGCTAAEPEITVAPTPEVVASATPEPTALTPDTDGTVEGAYPGVRLRFIPSDPSAALECRDLTRAERLILEKRGNRIDHPAQPAAIDLPEGWALVASWGSHAGVDPYVTAMLTDGETYQELPVNGSWKGTHTNAGVALEDGPRALSAALKCIGEGQA